MSGVRRYFIDTEFIEDGTTIELISIGVACDDGRTFYAESDAVNLSAANDWVKANVVPHLTGDRIGRDVIADTLIEFVAAGEGEPEFWAYYADYDWVAVCQLFGTMLDLPDGWPMFCMDIKQEAHCLGAPALPEQTSTEHHALADALWNAEAYAFIHAATPPPSPVQPPSRGRAEPAMHIIRRADGEEMGEFAFFATDGPEGWDVAENADHDDDTVYEILACYPVSRRKFLWSTLCETCDGEGDGCPACGGSGECEPPDTEHLPGPAADVQVAPPRDERRDLPSSTARPASRTRRHPARGASVDDLRGPAE